jgi:hypothetical protein
MPLKETGINIIVEHDGDMTEGLQVLGTGTTFTIELPAK